jgi:hypothetical protein
MGGVALNAPPALPLRASRGKATSGVSLRIRLASPVMQNAGDGMRCRGIFEAEALGE